MIEVENLVKVYAGRNGTRALDGVSFALGERDVFGFLGPNGAGKTTAIRILGGVLEPTTGTVRIAGHDLGGDALAAKKRIGMMPDEVAFYPTLSGMQHLLYYASFYHIPKADARARAKESLDRFGLTDARNRKVKGYSHGMKKRLALAQCLLHDPDVIIMDEPANGLDPQGMRYFRDLIRRLSSEGKTIFLSSHILSEVEQLCERVGIIDHGRMVAVDTIDNLTTRLAADAPPVVRVAATNVTDAALADLSAIPGVSSVERTEEGIVVTAEPGRDPRAEVSRVLVQSGAELLEVRRDHRTLEDLFLTLTKGGGP